MRKFSANIKLPFPTNMRSVVERLDVGGKLEHFHFDESKFDKRVLEFLSVRGITVSHYEVFYTPPQYLLPIHVDGAQLSNLVKMNFVYGAKGSRMMWWKPKKGSKMITGITPVNTPYLFAEQRSCVMIESAEIGQPTLVNVGQPHSVLNSTNEKRWCLSTVLAKDGVNLQWDQAVELLHDVLE